MAYLCKYFSKLPFGFEIQVLLNIYFRLAAIIIIIIIIIIINSLLQKNVHIHVNYIYFLNASRVGCHISDACINHVFYADDLCLMAPCVIALQYLLTIGYRYSVEVNLNFSATVFLFCFYT